MHAPGKEEIDEIVRHADNFLKIKPLAAPF